MKHCDEFLTFDMKSSKEMVDKINEILDKELPWEDSTPDLPF